MCNVSNKFSTFVLFNKLFNRLNLSKVIIIFTFMVYLEPFIIINLVFYFNN